MTYAERAKAIMKKYDRFKGDPISERSMDMELEQLAIEQEEEKAARGIPSEGQEMAYGGYKKMENGGYTDPPYRRTPQFPSGAPIAEIQMQRLRPSNLDPIQGIVPTPNQYTPQLKTDNILQAPKAINPTVTRFKEGMDNLVNPSLGGSKAQPQHIQDKANKLFGPKGILDPSVNVGADMFGKAGNIPKAGSADGAGTGMPGEAQKVGWKGMAGVAGNVYDLTDALINGPQEVSYDKLDPALISGENQKREARRSTNTAYNNVAEASRETSQSSGQRLGRTAAIESVRGQRVMEALNSINEQVANTNVGIKNRAQEYNTNLSNQEIQDNMQAKMAHRLRIANNLNNIGGGFAAQGAEQNQADADFAKNDRLIRAINNGVLTDFTMNELLEILAG